MLAPVGPACHPLHLCTSDSGTVMTANWHLVLRRFSQIPRCWMSEKNPLLDSQLIIVANLRESSFSFQSCKGHYSSDQGSFFCVLSCILYALFPFLVDTCSFVSLVTHPHLTARAYFQLCTHILRHLHCLGCLWRKDAWHPK